MGAAGRRSLPKSPEEPPASAPEAPAKWITSKTPEKGMTSKMRTYTDPAGVVWGVKPVSQTMGPALWYVTKDGEILSYGLDGMAHTLKEGIQKAEALIKTGGELPEVKGTYLTPRPMSAESRMANHTISAWARGSDELLNGAGPEVLKAVLDLLDETPGGGSKTLRAEVLKRLSK